MKAKVIRFKENVKNKFEMQFKTYQKVECYNWVSILATCAQSVAIMLGNWQE